MKRFLALLALVLGVVSCQTEPEGLNVNVGGEVDTIINVTIPEAETRAGGSNSAAGAFANGVLGTESDNTTMRYILQVYYKDGETYVKSAERKVEWSDGKTVAFDVRLVPERNYQFVVWADVVTNGKNDTDNHYNTSDLENITLLSEWKAMDESRDAFTATELIENFNASKPINITLRRPFAKLRVVTTDIESLTNLGIVPTTATVEYTTKHRVSFNALEGKAAGESLDNKAHTYDIAQYTNEINTGAEYTLFADYFFAEDDVVKFNLDVRDAKGVSIKENSFNTDIYAKRNHLTTIKGNILTDGKGFDVTIDDEFGNGTNWNPEDDKYDVDIWDGKSAKEPKFDAEKNAYLITTGAELAWIADQVNGVTRAAEVNTFKGKNVLLMNDINLNNEPWTPIGTGGYTNNFNGTFDGQGNTIANLRVKNTSCAGLIGGTTSAHVKNLTIDGVDLTTNHYAGAIIAWAESGATNVKIEDCTVKNAKITVTPELVGDKYDNGDKAGAIIGFSHVALISGCAAENVVITAFRDVAAIAGYANKGAVKNCTVKNATITSDQIIAYNGEKDGNAGVFVGRIGEAADTTGNTEGENIVVIRKVNSTTEFAEALKDRRNDDVIYVGEGEVVLPASLAITGNDKLTIEGLDANAAVQFNSKPGGADGGLNCYADGTELIFKKIKVVSPDTGSAYTGGFGRAKSVLFDNCYYEGQYRSMSYVKFNKCTIDPKTSYIYTDYSDADFVECTFNCSEGKGIQVYNDGNTTDTTINVTDCTFTAAKQGQTWDKKPVTAIDINSNGEKFTVNIDRSTATGFPKGEYTDETLFNIKGGGRNIKIYVDGTLWVAPYKPVTDENGNTVEGVLANPEGDIQVTADQGWDYFAQTVLDGESYDGKLVTLTNDIDLANTRTINNNSNAPVGKADSNTKIPFKGTFNGDGHTIKNLYQSGWDFDYNWDTIVGYLGLFAMVEDAVIQDIVIDGATIEIEGGTLGAVAGYAKGTTEFKNITVTNSKLGSYNNRLGGVVGWTAGGAYTFENINIESDVVLGGLWGSFDTSVGGVMGQLNTGASAVLKNVNVACRLDVYNDCTASYDYYNYRMCGMLIGQMTKTTTIDGTTYPDVAAYDLTCENVTVTYGDWMNYHYCRAAGARAQRVESGFTYGGIAADRDHDKDTVHCYECIPFDQLFGGTQFGCKGVKTWDGVTVNYPDEYTCPLCGEQHNVK